MMCFVNLSKRFYFLCAGLILILSISVNASDEAKDRSTSSSKKVTTIIVDNYYPYTFVNKNKDPDGFSVDLIKAVTKVMGMELEIHAGAWEQAKEALIDGSIDFLPMMAYSKERDTLFDFSVPHTIAYDAFFIRNTSIKISAMDDLKGKTVIVMKDDQAHDYLRLSGLIEPENLIFIKSIPEALRLLASGKGDAALMPKIVGLIAIKDLGLKNLVLSPAIIEAYNRPFSFSVKEGNQLLLERLNQGLSIVKATNQYGEIYEKWFGAIEPKELPFKAVFKYILMVFFAFVLIGLALTLWSISLRKQVAIRTRDLEDEILVRKRVEQALRKNEKRLIAAQHIAKMGDFTWDVETGKVTWSDALFDLLQYDKSEIVDYAGVNAEIHHPDDLDRVTQWMNNCISSGKEVLTPNEYRLFRKDGKVIYVRSVGVIERKEGKSPKVFATIQDITKRKQGEEDVARTAREWQTTFDAVPDTIWILDKDQRVLRSNKQAELLFQRLCGELIGKHCWEIVHGTKQPISGCPIPRARHSLRRETMELQLGEGWFKVTVDPILDAAGEYAGAVHIVSDITEHKRTEDALRKSEQKYRLLVESTADWVWACDPAGRQTFANNAVKNMLGYETHEIIGAAAYSLMHPEDAERVQTWLKKSVEIKKGWSNTVLRWKHKDGTTKFLESTASPVLDSEGNLIGFAGTDRDVTERLRLEQQLLQTQKMEAIGTLAGGVAHDFNNLLSIIFGNTDLMLMEIRKDHPFYKGLKEIRNAATGAAYLTRQLLAFSRKQVIQPEIMNLNDVINATTKMLARLISENIEIQMFLDPALEPIEADSGQMEQVIINLAVNARDAMPSGGKLTVETKNLDLNEDFFKSQGVEGEAGPYVMLRVSDTGSGIDQEILLHIFDPFFTTKGIERGTGLGLATVYGIVKQNNGYIFVDSKPGKGSAFEIYLPAAKRERKPVAAKIVAEDNLTGSEIILLVEDDMQLQKLTARILKRYGYRVLQASNGAEALKVSQKHNGPIDLILADVIMPGMNIREVADKIRSQRKEAKILYMSGHMDDALSHYGVLEPGINFLQKPYTPEHLARRVRQVLDKKIDD